MKATVLTQESFNNKVANMADNEWKFVGERPVLIDFYASWCGPCKMLAPVIDELAAEYEGKVDIYKVNVDEESDLAAKFNIRTIPTLLFIPMNEKPRMMQGALPKSQLKSAINDVLLK